MIREDGELRPASWPEAFAVAARGLAGAGASGVLTGGRVTAEDAYAYAKFARVSLGTNDVDFRARPLSAEEAAFLASDVVLSAPVTYADLETASTVVLAGLEPEDEAGTIFLRLRKAVRSGGPTRVVSVAPFASRGLRKLDGHLVATRPGDEPAALSSLLGHAEHGALRDGRGAPSSGTIDATAVILVGERLATVPGALSAAADLARKSGARLAWVPRRAGDRGAVEAGCLPTLLPGGRPVADAAARVDAATTWGVDSLPETAGRDADAIVAAINAGELGGLVVGGVDPDDTADPAATRAALAAASFVVALDLRETEVTRGADVVFPVAPVTDKAGTFVTWEGRPRPFEAVLHNPGSLPDLRILSGIADELGVLGHGSPLGFRTVAEARAEMTEMGPWDGDRPAAPTVAAAKPASGVRLATWKQLLDNGRLQDGDPALRATARDAVARVPAARAPELGEAVTITGDRGSVTLPAVATDDLTDDTVWLPANSFGRGVLADLASPGSTVTVTGGTL
jgi:NADH-quinone oxidoreductase subunit G